MQGGWAVLIFAGFLVIAGILFSGIVAGWRAKPNGQLSYAKLIGITAFLALWFGLISMHYLNGLRFLYQIATAASLRNIFRANWEARFPRPSSN